MYHVPWAVGDLVAVLRRSIAALLLSHLGEEDAFWCLCFLTDAVMVQWFAPKRVALEV